MLPPPEAPPWSLLTAGEESVLFQEVFQARHPVGECAAPKSIAEAVMPLLIDVNLGGRSRSRQVREQLRGSDRVPGVAGGAKNKRGREILQRFSGSGPAGSVDQAQIIGPGREAIDRIGGIRISWTGPRTKETRQARPRGKSDEANAFRIQLPFRGPRSHQLNCPLAVQHPRIITIAGREPVGEHES